MQKVLLFLFLNINFCISAQVGELHDGKGYGFQLVQRESGDMSEISGSPYLESNFKKGAVLIEGKEPLAAFIKYNVLKELMEVKLTQQENNIYTLPRDEKTVYQIGMDKFQLMKIATEDGTIFGYFKTLYNGNNVQLLLKNKARLTEPVKARTGYEKDKPAEIEIYSEYYLKIPKEPAKQVEPSHRKVRKIFSDDDEISTYLKANKVKDEKDLISLANFIDKN